MITSPKSPKEKDISNRIKMIKTNIKSNSQSPHSLRDAKQRLSELTKELKQARNERS